MKWAVIGILVASLLVGFVGWQLGQRDATTNAPPTSKAKNSIVGVYLQDIKAPVAAKMRLEIHADGRWVMANMLTGYWGTWKAKAPDFDFLNTEGPTGMIKSPSHILVKILPKGTLKLGIGGNSIDFLRQPDASPFLLPIDPNAK
ncbi:MAG: hypothetical protein IT203_07380 [Fimbriimonadaceae bacterium]|nr:hypothetical protein [Fimbriimonadaceae bacterium]